MPACAEADLFDAPAGSAAAACVGFESLPPHLRAAVGEALRRPRDGGGAGGGGDRARADSGGHSYTLLRASPPRDARARVRPLPLPASLQRRDAAHRIALLSPAATRAARLGAHLGVVTLAAAGTPPTTGATSRFWLLLPRGGGYTSAAPDPAAAPLVASATPPAATARVAPAAAAAAAEPGRTTEPDAADGTRTATGPAHTAPMTVHMGTVTVTHTGAHILSPERGAWTDGRAGPEPLMLEPAAPPIARCMLVDDEATLRRMGSRMLQSLHVSCDTVADGSEVASALTPSHELLLLDIVMRYSDGAQARARERAWPCGFHTRFCLRWDRPSVCWHGRLH